MNIKYLVLFSWLALLLTPLTASAASSCKGPAPGEALSLAGCEVGDQLVLREIKFDTDSAVIKEESKPLLKQVAEVLLQNPQLPVSVDGHTDSRASDAYNLGLSQRRASSVMQYLITAGVPASNIQARGFGLRRPMATNETPEGRALNRRVELSLVAEGADAGPELDVYISTFAAKPSTITVPVGSKIEWHNYDEISHNISFGDETSMRIWTESWKGTTYTKTFSRPGTYSYHCTVHNDVAGQVVVKAVNEVKAIDSPAYGGQTTTSYRPVEKSVPYRASYSTQSASAPLYPASNTTYQSSSEPMEDFYESEVDMAEDHAVEIKNFAFGPEELVVSAGSMVSWKNADNSRHSIAFEGEESDVLANGDSFSKGFSSPGEYNYSCGLHSSMKGVVRVE